MNGTPRVVKASAYPAKGFLFLVRTPRLWSKVVLWTLLGIAVCIAISVILLVYALPAQIALMKRALPDWFSIPVGVILTIIECAAASLFWTVLYAELFVFDAVFKEVLRIKGHEQLASGFTIHRKHAHKIFFFMARKTIFKTVVPGIHAILTIALLPVNIVPFLGWALYFMLHGYLIGYGAHLTYFDLKGLKFKEAKAYVESHKTQYLSFGTAAAALQMIPILGIFFGFTNVIGAALWASNLEKHGEGPVKGGGSDTESNGSSSSSESGDNEPRPVEEPIELTGTSTQNTLATEQSEIPSSAPPPYEKAALSS